MAKSGDLELVSTDTDTLEELIGQLNVAANKIEQQITSIYTAITAMNEFWSGESYDTFTSQCNEAKPSLDALVLFIRAYAELLNTTVKNASDKYINDAASALGGNG